MLTLSHLLRPTLSMCDNHYKIKDPTSTHVPTGKIMTITFDMCVCEKPYIK